MESIKITKTTISLNKEQFKQELVDLAKKLKELTPSQIGIAAIVLKKELNLKLSPLQFAELAKDLGFKLHLEKFILIKDILK